VITLYHGATSVCSQKVRIALAEKGLEWESRMLNLAKSEQLAPDYVKLNPNGVVPTLVNDDFVIRESSVIIDYVNQLSDQNELMPGDPEGAAKVRLWLLRTLEIHSSINTMSFASVFRDRDLRIKSPGQLAAQLAKMPDRQAAAKRKDLLENGVKSPYVANAIAILTRTLSDMNDDLEGSEWITGEQFGLGDIGVVTYIHRLEMLALEDLWRKRYSNVAGWLERMQRRPSFKSEVYDYLTSDEEATYHAAGMKVRPEIIAIADELHSRTG